MKATGSKTSGETCLKFLSVPGFLRCSKATAIELKVRTAADNASCNAVRWVKVWVKLCVDAKSCN